MGISRLMVCGPLPVALPMDRYMRTLGVRHIAEVQAPEGSATETEDDDRPRKKISHEIGHAELSHGVAQIKNKSFVSGMGGIAKQQIVERVGRSQAGGKREPRIRRIRAFPVGCTPWQSWPQQWWSCRSRPWWRGSTGPTSFRWSRPSPPLRRWA